jgi:glycosyltransferase involved in cell wall biosynthesis
MAEVQEHSKAEEIREWGHREERVRGGNGERMVGGPAAREQGVELSIVLPIYDELENVGPLLDEIHAALDPTGKDYEIIAVDDGSRDGTTQRLRALVETDRRLKAVFFRRNSGQAAAFDAGFRNASGDVIVTMDADRQNDPADIPKLLAKLDEGYDVVTGWRRDRKDTLLLRKIPSRIANGFIRFATRTKTHDLGCSLKAYRRAITDEMRLYGEMHRFISVLADSLGASIGEVVVNHRARQAGRSKYGLKRTLKVVLDLLTVWFLRRYQTKPLYVFGGVGMAALGLGGLISVFVLWEKLADGVWVHRNPLFLIAIMCMLMGAQFVGTGLLAEMIMRTYFESQDKRAYSVASRAGFDRKP